MSSSIQLLTFFISFLYGIIFSFLTILNFKILDKVSKYMKHLVTFVYVIDMIIIYIIIVYKINNGYFHLYFILTVIVSYFVGLLTYYKKVSKIDVNRLFSKLKK